MTADAHLRSDDTAENATHIVKVADIRRKRGYSLTDLAVTSGLTEKEILEIEEGGATDVAYLQRLAAALQVQITELREYHRNLV